MVEASGEAVACDYNSVFSRLVLCKTFRLEEDGKVTPHHGHHGLLSHHHDHHGHNGHRGHLSHHHGRWSSCSSGLSCAKHFASKKGVSPSPPSSISPPFFIVTDYPFESQCLLLSQVKFIITANFHKNLIDMRSE